MRQSVLYKRSSFFIDIFNVMYYLDLFLFHEMKERMKNDECLRYFFSEKIPSIEPSPQNDIMIVRTLSGKLHKNILMDWINRDRFCEINQRELLDIYVESLVKDMVQNPICDQFIQLTEFGHTIRILCNDTNTKNVTLYAPYNSELIVDSIKESFHGYNIDKLSMFTGKKDNKAKEFAADSYVLEDAQDIDNYLCTKHPGMLVEVLIPSYEYNLKTDRTDMEKMVEQIMITRLNIKNNDSWYKDNFNLSINTIAVPI